MSYLFLMGVIPAMDITVYETPRDRNEFCAILKKSE
jgi:hypothetical protein